jgi:chromosome segregation protein
LLNFSRLKLSGFKSFVEPVEFFIEPGLTGIVGPNGCGKSNIVEALRWVMGESSAKAMRGGEMDDVIFGGTQSRPARNIAEVQLLLDNRERAAPAAFNGADEIEVMRRIERGAGSSYRVNGSEVRARDVQILFADASTGARSGALVSQGRIAALINAKPTDRRVLLEEAAGITGLHGRRHEAELRLRAAESNLERLDDVLQTMETQLQGLKRQARQASRYRNLSDHIRRAEALLLHLRWQAMLGEIGAAAALLREAELQVAALTERAAHCASEQADAAMALPGLRQAEAEAAAALHRQAVARDALDAEERRVSEALAASDKHLAQIAQDAAREETLLGDVAAALERLAGETAELGAARAGEAELAAAAQGALDQASAAALEAEGAVGALLEAVAAGEAQKAALERRLKESEGRATRLGQREREIGQERAALEAQSGVTAAREEARLALEQASAAADEARHKASAAEDERAAAQAAETQAREALRAPEAAHGKLAAEAAALDELLAEGRNELWPPLLDSVTVEPGYEGALSAALGDDLLAPLDEGAPMHWRALPPLEDHLALPPGCTPLSDHVAAPPALQRRLSQIGLAPDEATARVLAARLAPGQRLVTRDGALWRWDGFTITSGAATASTRRLAQRNRLAVVRDELERATVALEAARSALIEAEDRARLAYAAERSARETAREAQSALDAARTAEAELVRQVAALGTRLAALEDAAGQLAQDLAELERERAEAEAARIALPDLAADRARLERARGELAERRAEQRERQSAHDRLLREAEARAARLATIETETTSWQARAEAARRQRFELAERRDAAAAEREMLAAKPAEIATRRSELLDLIAAAEAARRDAADRLAAAETRLADADRALKEAEAALHAAREDRVRREAAVAQAEQAQAALAERVRERLNCTPEDALALAELKEGEEPPELAAIEQRLSRLVAERDNMGPVNLRAEQEARETEAQIDSLKAERADLVGAIARLRQAIGELNREGRERLLASFEAVNGHFERLFERLFGGGRAHLQLTEAADPLEAGLEVMASPPGKKLQALSLLSGGEQALTALALLFAVFLTNPAPICVLDEVDAPLDDANVDRLCSLLEDIAHSTATRFLVVTHHRMTMARMDRLFGVTMAERGVSQLVSVDLQRAERLRQTAA